MLRSMYFLGIDTTKEKPEDPNAPPPEPTQYLKDYLLDLWEKCDEINKELLFPLRTDPDLQGKLRGSLICGGKWIGSQFLDILNNDVNMVLGSMSSCLILMSLRCDLGGEWNNGVNTESLIRFWEIQEILHIIIWQKQFCEIAVQMISIFFP